MEKIKRLRLQIDQTDEEIMKRLTKRFELSQEIIDEKESMGLGRFDKNREIQILDKAKLQSQKTQQVYIEILRISKENL